MEDKKAYSFELHEEMLSLIEDEFSPQGIAVKLAEAVKDKPSPDVPKIGEEIFNEYGERWAERVIDLGESYMDRTYEILRQAIDQTGSPAFPLIPQRFIEIAYLSTQRISTLPIIENNISRFIFRVDNCRTYQALLDKCGQSLAESLPCRHGCLNLCGGIMEGLDLEGIKTEMPAITPEQGNCQFLLKNTRA